MFAHGGRLLNSNTWMLVAALLYNVAASSAADEITAALECALSF